MTTSDKAESQPRLSVAMIVRDAAALVADSIGSMRGVADEIVVVDTGSTDNTVEVARGQGATVHEIAWDDSFAAARNECIWRTSGQWVLWLDAGETLVDTAAQQLRNFVDESADPNKAYLVFIQRPACHAASSCERIGQLRLLPNRPELTFTGRLREQVLPAVLAAGMAVDALDLTIDRPASDADPERRAARATRNLKLANLVLASDGELPQALCVRAEALAVLGHAKEAEQVYRRLLELDPRGSSEMLEAYYGLLTAMDGRPDQANAQIALCVEALEIYPLDAQLLCGMGGYLLRQQRLDLAARSYEMAVVHGRVDPAIWHLADLADVAVGCLSLTHQLMGNSQRAESVLREALAERPDSISLRRALVELYAKSGRKHDALVECSHFPEDFSDREAMRDVVRGAVLVVKKKVAEALPYLTNAYAAGCRDTFCFRWLATAQLAQGNLDAVEALADQWERRQPGNLEIRAFRQAVAGRRQGGQAAGPPTALQNKPHCFRGEAPAPLDAAPSGPALMSPQPTE
jgi:tetratricopeptide (TPR) repeat protein